MKKPQWPFASSPNTAVFTSKKIIFGNEWIYYVCHDAEDGAWQFHPVGFTKEDEVAIVSLEEMCNLDSSIFELWNLPYGWFAWRPRKDDNWIREPN